MKNYQKFLESIKPIMKFYAYDWDDNILMMPTVIHMKHLINDKWIIEDVSTEKFAKIRNDSNWKAFPESFLEFRDNGPRGSNAFLEDTKTAINNGSFGPSWDSFLKCLTGGSIFAIITARGHEPDTIRNAVEYIINNILTQEQKNEMIANLIAFQDMFVQNFNVMKNIDSTILIDAYLDNCDFVSISSPSFQEKYNNTADVTNPEIAKTIALDDFIKRINTYGKQVDGDVRIGFSDDDKKNVNKVIKHFNEINNLYNNITFSVIDTSDQNITGGIKEEI